MSVEDVLRLAGEAGLRVDGVVVGTEPDTVPRAPSHQWVLVPMSDGRITLGGMDRGSFVPYGVYRSDG